MNDKIFRISVEKLEMQLCKKSALYLKRCGVQLRKKNTWGFYLGVVPPGAAAPGGGQGLIMRMVNQVR